MKLFNCEHPKKITNPYTGEELLVPCGNCATCLNRRSASWVERLEVERMCWRYCFFITLTYSDDYVPYFNYDRDSLSLYDPDTGELVLDCSKQPLDYNDYCFICGLGDKLKVAKVEHIQKFIKRLRSKIYDNEQEKLNARLRYFVVSEYGETNFRPHYHGLLFTNSKWFAENAYELVRSAWQTDNRYSQSEQYGIVDCQSVRQSAASYVAGYVNSFVSLPKIYQSKGIRPFALFSRSPSIGTLPIGTSEIQKLLVTASPTVNLYCRTKQQLTDRLLPVSLKSRLWPYVRAFDSISHGLRVKLYSVCTDFRILSYQDFVDWSDKVLVHGFDSDELREYLSKVVTGSESGFKRLYTNLRRFDYNRTVIGWSVEQYLQKMYSFKHNYEQYKLKQQYLMQDDLIVNGKLSPTDLLLIDPLYLDSIRCSVLSERDFLILKSYGYGDSSFTEVDDLVVNGNIEYLDMCAFNQEFFRKRSKMRKLKSYYDVSDKKTYNLIKTIYG